MNCGFRQTWGQKNEHHQNPDMHTMNTLAPVTTELSDSTTRHPRRGRAEPAEIRRVSVRTALAVAGVGALLISGCASMGPPTIDRDRFDYVTSISESWKRQMLLNLLKVRYADAPVFMDVASVISSYSLEGEVRLGGQYAQVGRGDTFGSVGATGRYADKPTITYQPLAGEKFAKSLMAPVPVSGVLFLIQSGYPADLVLRICVSTINGIENAFGGPGNPRAGNPKFRELMTALRESQAAGDTGFRMKKTREGEEVVLFVRPLAADASAPRHRIRELLDLDPALREYRIVYGSVPDREGEIAILTRSILQVIIDVSSYIAVPQADMADGRTYRPQRTTEQEKMFPALLTVHHGDSPPDVSHVAVRYRDQWFWIDDRDHPSKFALNFLLMMSSLTEGAPSQPAPVVTVPAR
jgi:hypothetical protein